MDWLIHRLHIGSRLDQGTDVYKRERRFFHGGEENSERRNSIHTRPTLMRDRRWEN